jgi:hypothetical protein
MADSKTLPEKLEKEILPLYRNYLCNNTSFKKVTPLGRFEPQDYEKTYFSSMIFQEDISNEDIRQFREDFVLSKHVKVPHILEWVTIYASGSDYAMSSLRDSLSSNNIARMLFGDGSIFGPQVPSVLKTEPERAKYRIAYYFVGNSSDFKLADLTNTKEEKVESSYGRKASAKPIMDVFNRKM